MGDDNNNGFPLSDEKMDELFKLAVKLELDKRKALGLPYATAETIGNNSEDVYA